MPYATRGFESARFSTLRSAIYWKTQRTVQIWSQNKKSLYIFSKSVAISIGSGRPVRFDLNPLVWPNHFNCPYGRVRWYFWVCALSGALGKRGFFPCHKFKVARTAGVLDRSKRGGVKPHVLYLMIIPEAFHRGNQPPGSSVGMRTIAHLGIN